MKLSQLLCLSILVASCEVQAATVDFDPTPIIVTSPAPPNNQTFLEGLWRVESFRYYDTGSAAWTEPTAESHFHVMPDPFGSGSVEWQHFNEATELQGFFIERVDFQPFSLNSLDYRVSGNTAISGFSPTNVQILLADETFVPSGSVTSRFAAFAVGAPTFAYSTLNNPAGFDLLTRLYVASSGDVNFDNINVSLAPIPEPSTYALMLAGLSFVGFVAHRRRKAQAAAFGHTPCTSTA
jgi:hypothetical protein